MFRRTLLSIVSLILLAEVAIAGGRCVPSQSRERAAVGASLLLRIASELPFDLLEAAADHWRSCREHGTGFPEIRTYGVATRTVWIDYRPGVIGDGRCGSFQARRITLHDTMRSADGRVLPCGALDQNLAHEIGHALGLRDIHDPACGHFVMAPIRFPGPVRKPRPLECAAVDSRWLTFAEAALVELHPAEIGSGRAR